MNKYRESSFGFWWIEICGNEDISGQEYIGNIDCSNNQIISLEGCPSSVIGSFDCSNNKLTSLEGCPASAIGSICIGKNQC